MKHIALTSVLAMLSALPVSSFAGDEKDEGGIVGTGRTAEVERPEALQHFEIPERVERPDVVSGERPDLTGVPSIEGGENRPPTIEPAMPAPRN